MSISSIFVVSVRGGQHTIGAKRVDVSIGRFGCTVGWDLFETLVNARKANELKKARLEWTCTITLIGPDSRVAHCSSAEQVPIKTDAILQFEDVRQDGVVEQVCPDLW